MESTKPKKILYCIAYNLWSQGNVWVPQKDYTHAVDVGEARWTFFQDLQSNRKRVIIVGIAPVLGYFVDDNHGDKLSV